MASDITTATYLERVQTGCSSRRDDDRLPRNGQSIRATLETYDVAATASIYLAKTADREHGLIHHAPDAGQRIINGRDAILREHLKRWAGIRLRAARDFKSRQPTSITDTDTGSEADAPCLSYLQSCR